MSSFKGLLAMRCGCVVLKAEEKLIKRIRTNKPVFSRWVYIYALCKRVSVAFLVLLLCLWANWYGSTWGFVCFMSWWKHSFGPYIFCTWLVTSSFSGHNWTIGNHTRWCIVTGKSCQKIGLLPSRSQWGLGSSRNYVLLHILWSTELFATNLCVILGIHYAFFSAWPKNYTLLKQLKMLTKKQKNNSFM